MIVARCHIPVGLVLLTASMFTAASAHAETFARYPGFDAWFAANPPDPQRPALEERELLQRHRPLLHIPTDHPGPIDFYRDYIAHGTLTVGGQRWQNVDRALLARHVDDPEAEFRHRPPADPDPHPVAYGRIDRARLGPIGELTFLTWHFVFRTSGLPAEMPFWQSLLARTLGDPNDWHQLDHYTAATLVLGPGQTPLGLILQQHNTVRAYWYGRDLDAPADGRPRIAAARRSNELYPWRGERARHRVVRFLEPDNLHWLASGNGDAPWTASHDVVTGAREVDYEVHFLPQTDPFYRFQGQLGASRLLPGRDGPPGADYNTLPAFKDRALQFCALRWSGKAGTERLAALKRLLESPDAEGPREHLLDGCRTFIQARIDHADPPTEPAPAIGYNAPADDQGQPE